MYVCMYVLLLFFICFILTANVKQSAVLVACIFRAMTKKVCQLYLGKKCIR